MNHKILKINNHLNFVSLVFIAFAVVFIYQPLGTLPVETLDDSFNVEKALTHVSQMSQAKHFTGSNGHESVKRYILNALNEMGLNPMIQKTFIDRNRRVSLVENIVAIKKGSNPSAKKLLLMSHYDSAPYTSKGASDAATGVAVILEGVRAFMKYNTEHSNDIVILITDAEEMGLLGAKAFAEKHPLATDIGFVLNFEARGTSGPSSMLIETNGGNKNILEAFKQADVKYPNSSSIHYSIYKMMPSDMDMTVFREDKNISGMNFAYIDNHFNYHTENDSFPNLSINSLAHHASYLMPLLKTLGNINLEELNAETDDVFFQFPLLKTLNYPFSSTFIISLTLLAYFFILYGFSVKANKVSVGNTIKASVPFIKALAVSLLLTMSLLKFVYWLHPQYAEIYQGFPYNGHWYMAFFMLMSVCISFYFINQSRGILNDLEKLIFPTALWVIISLLTSTYLPGAHYLSALALCGLILWTLNLLGFTSKSVMFLTMIPVLIIVFPITWQLPIAMGLDMLPLSVVIIVLVSCLIAPIFNDSNHHTIQPLHMFVLCLPLLIAAEFNASTTETRPLPVSLVHYQDNIEQKSYWMSADSSKNSWIEKQLKTQPVNSKEELSLPMQRIYPFQQISLTEFKGIETQSSKLLQSNLTDGDSDWHFQLKHNRTVHRTIIRAGNDMKVLSLTINGENMIGSEALDLKEGDFVASIYQTENNTSDLEITLNSAKELKLWAVEYSANLLESEHFQIEERPSDLIAKPYGYSDIIITKSEITF